MMLRASGIFPIFQVMSVEQTSRPQKTERVVLDTGKRVMQTRIATRVCVMEVQLRTATVLRIVIPALRTPAWMKVFLTQAAGLVRMILTAMELVMEEQALTQIAMSTTAEATIRVTFLTRGVERVLVRSLCWTTERRRRMRARVLQTERAVSVELRVKQMQNVVFQPPALVLVATLVCVRQLSTLTTVRSLIPLKRVTCQMIRTPKKRTARGRTVSQQSLLMN